MAERGEERRKREIREHEVIRLTNEGSRAFVEALLDPPEPNENLRRLARESKLAWPPKVNKGKASSDEESVRTRRFPGIGFQGAEGDRRAWLIGTGFEVWEVVQLYEELGRETVLQSGRISERQLDLALAYRAEHPEEIDAAVEENREAPHVWMERYPALGISVGEY